MLLLGEMKYDLTKKEVLNLLWSILNLMAYFINNFLTQAHLIVLKKAQVPNWPVNPIFAWLAI